MTARRAFPASSPLHAEQRISRQIEFVDKLAEKAFRSRDLNEAFNRDGVAADVRDHPARAGDFGGARVDDEHRCRGIFGQEEQGDHKSEACRRDADDAEAQEIAAHQQPQGLWIGKMRARPGSPPKLEQAAQLIIEARAPGLILAASRHVA